MEITANALQTVADSEIVIFTDTAISGNYSILHREGSGLISIRGITNQGRARFRVTFGANVGLPTGGTGAITLALAVNGEPFAPAIMISTPAAAEQFNAVSKSIFIDVAQGCCAQISVENRTGAPVEVQNANLIVERVA